jgi:excisionase family DNA binding protein
MNSQKPEGNRIEEALEMGLMTLEELANYLRVTKKTIYRLLERGRIPARKVGHQWRFDKASIDTWLRESSKKGVVNILVVDDDEEICSLFKDALVESGFTVTTVNSSSKGLELIKDQDYSLIFLDLKMPEMDGAELFKRIKEVKPNLPVTIITGYPDSDLMLRALTYGPLGIMNKPFSGSDILAAVNNYLRFRD